MKEYTIQSVVRVYGWEELTPEDRKLIEAAKEATQGSYAPYSGFCVGAAARLKNGTIVIVDKNKARLGAFEIGEWEQWFDINELCEEMSKYCGEVSYVDSIPYENLEADGLFVAWIGKVK